MARHTPGPWEAGFDFNEKGERHLFPHVYLGPHMMYPDGSGHGWRAMLIVNEGPTPEDVAEGAGMGTTIETADANARLIALAPTMLALLAECVPYIQRSRFGNPGADALLARIEAAILVSEGK